VPNYVFLRCIWETQPCPVQDVFVRITLWYHPQTPPQRLAEFWLKSHCSTLFVWQQNPPITHLQLHPHAWRFQEVILNGISAFPHVSLHRSTTRSKTKPAAANDKYITSLGNSGERVLDHKIPAVRTRRSRSFESVSTLQ